MDRKKIKFKIRKHGISFECSDVSSISSHPKKEEIIKYIKLYCSVIDTALSDIIEPNNISEYVEAYKWFNIENVDFLQICDCAFVPPEKILDIFNELKYE